MKKKLNIVEIAIAIISIAAAVFGAQPSYTPLRPKSYECLIFEMDIHQLHAVETVDAKGSKYVHTDIVPRHLVQVFYHNQTSGKKYWQCWQAKINSNGKSLNGSGENRQSIMVMNPREGSNDGYIVFIMDIPRLDAYMPSIQCHLSGTFEAEWLEDEQRYIVKSGQGVVGGHSTATKFGAWEYMEQASLSVQSPMAPAWGKFTVRHAVLTETEIINLIK